MLNTRCQSRLGSKQIVHEISFHYLSEFVYHALTVEVFVGQQPINIAILPSGITQIHQGKKNVLLVVHVTHKADMPKKEQDRTERFQHCVQPTICSLVTQNHNAAINRMENKDRK